MGEDIPKQYIEIANKPIIYYCLEKIKKSKKVDAIYIVAEDEWREFICKQLKQLQLLPLLMGFSNPGITRQLSIINALEDLNNKIEGNDIIIIHDAVRPCIDAKDVDNYIEMLGEHDGVLPVLEVKDTVYSSENGKVIDSLLNRDNLYAGQAPEVFRFQVYYQVNKLLEEEKILNIKGSTEPAILGGLDVILAKGNEDNFKITTRADLERFKIKIKDSIEG